MRAILIKEVDGNTLIKEVEVNNYKDYYKHLECDLFDIVMVDWLGERLSLYVDDEGLLKSGNKGRFVKGYPDPLFGNIVVVGGVDMEGNTLPLPESISRFDIPKLITGAIVMVK